jgi:NTE family protein
MSALGSSRPRTAFVLSGGASLGAVQAGMLRALYERDITADLLVGTSAGALNAAFIASRPQTIETARALRRVWCDLQRDDIFPVSMRALVGGLCGKRDHLVPDAALRRLVRRHIDYEDLADAATPVHVVAYDVTAAQEVLLSEGSAVDAIIASAAIPGVFPPVAIGDWQLIDGGVVNNTPISHAVALGAERVYVLPTQTGPRRIARPPAGAIDAAIHALTLLVDARFASDIARYAREVELIVLRAPNTRHVQPTDFAQGGRLSAEALAACRELLAEPSLALAA